MVKFPLSYREGDIVMDPSLILTKLGASDPMEAEKFASFVGLNTERSIVADSPG